MKRRILLATHLFPFPWNYGGAQRTELLHRALGELGEVDVAILCGRKDYELRAEAAQHYRFVFHECPRWPESALYWQILKKLGVPGPRIVRWARRLDRDHRILREDGKLRAAFDQTIHLSAYDAVVTRYMHAANLLDLYRHPRLFVDLDGYQPAAYRNEAQFARPARARRLEEMAQRWESAIASKKVAAYLLCNPGDMGAIREQPVHWLPNLSFHGSPKQVPSRQPQADFATVAAFTHPPNVDAVDFFLEAAWPQVVGAHPEAGYRIVGKGIDASMRKRWERIPGVNVVGYADDLAEVYQKALAVIVSTRKGAGTHLKVLEAYAYRCPCIVTPFGLRGYESHLRPGAECLLGTNGDELADACLRLLAKPEEAIAMGFQGQAALREDFSYAKFRQTVAKLLA